MGKDVTAMCCDCQQCQSGQIYKQPAAPLHAIPVPACRFSHVHVDLVGPLPASSEGHVYLLTAIDRSTRWVEGVPLRNMEANTCTDAFIVNWVACFVVPATFVATPLLGMNFLTMIGLSIIPAKQQVLNAHARHTLYHHQQNSLGWVIFLHLARRATLPAPFFYTIYFLWV
jgi:hypothetical protein